MYKKILFGASFLILGCMGSLYFAQERLIFRGVPTGIHERYRYKSNFEEIFLQTEENVKINALHFKIPSPRGVVFYFHGQGGNLANPWGKRSREFTSRGYDCFMIDYRSFGKSRGVLSESGILKDALECYTYLKKFYKEKEIVLYGSSLGSGIANLCSFKE